MPGCWETTENSTNVTCASRAGEIEYVGEIFSRCEFYVKFVTRILYLAIYNFRTCFRKLFFRLYVRVRSRIKPPLLGVDYV